MFVLCLVDRRRVWRIWRWGFEVERGGEKLRELEGSVRRALIFFCSATSGSVWEGKLRGNILRSSNEEIRVYWRIWCISHDFQGGRVA